MQLRVTRIQFFIFIFDHSRGPFHLKFRRQEVGVTIPRQQAEANNFPVVPFAKKPTTRGQTLHIGERQLALYNLCLLGGGNIKWTFYSTELEVGRHTCVRGYEPMMSKHGEEIIRE